jgi:hypothetical protein
MASTDPTVTIDLSKLNGPLAGFIGTTQQLWELHNRQHETELQMIQALIGERVAVKADAPALVPAAPDVNRVTFDARFLTLFRRCLRAAIDPEFAARKSPYTIGTTTNAESLRHYDLVVDRAAGTLSFDTPGAVRDRGECPRLTLSFPVARALVAYLARKLGDRYESRVVTRWEENPRPNPWELPPNKPLPEPPKEA